MHRLGASPLSLVMSFSDQPRFLARQVSLVGNNRSGALGMTGLQVYPRASAVNDLQIPIGIPDDQASRSVFIRADSWMS